jgi:hypothetical protein
VFVPGLELSRRLYVEAVRPLLAQHLPGLAHTAALIGPGSEVLGFDTERSTDHDWGARLQLFPDARRTEVQAVLAERLPATFGGHPTGVVVADLGDWLAGRLGFNPLERITTLDWLATPSQALAEVTTGAVHHDGLGRLAPLRRELAWYPDDLWRYLLACQWERVSEEEPFVGRCGEVGDELGSAVVAARLVRDLMRLCLLMGRTYPPYGKWLGSAFARLPDAATLTPTLMAVLAAPTWHDREHHLTIAYESVARRHNDLGLTPPVDPHVRLFYDRPFRVLGGERFAAALVGTIADPAVRGLPLTGGIDQFVDSTAVLTHPDRGRSATAALHA